MHAESPVAAANCMYRTPTVDRKARRLLAAVWADSLVQYCADVTDGSNCARRKLANLHPYLSLPGDQIIGHATPRVQSMPVVGVRPGSASCDRSATGTLFGAN